MNRALVVSFARFLGALALPATPVGCVFFTGSTSGYSLGDAGSVGSPCERDGGCSGLSNGCASAADCNPDGGTQACCLALSMSQSVATTCGAQPCAMPGAQLCHTDAECGAQSCINATCTFDGITAVVPVCSDNPFCTAR
jgi:hypothetical protein